MAEAYDVKQKIASKILLTTTLISIFTLPLLKVLLNSFSTASSPIMNPISTPQVAVGLSESQPAKDQILIVSFKSPSPANKLIILAAKFIPAAAHALHFIFLEVRS